MKVIIATVQIPFVNGGAEYLANNLKIALEHAGHYAELVKVPFKWYPPDQLPQHILACRLYDLTECNGMKTDLLIGLKFPAYYFYHPNKVLWILHQHREAYELWGTEFGGLHRCPVGPDIKHAITRADNLYLKEAQKIFTISQNVSFRLNQFNGISSSSLYPPCADKDKLYCESYDDFVLFPSRLNGIKRQHLAIEAMQHVKSGLRLYLAGKADTQFYLNHLKNLVRKYRLEEKVKFLDFVSEEEKRTLYARCRTVLFPTFDEDYGYVTLEAFYSNKPVITCKDSGAPLEFVENHKTGIVCDPDPQKIAEAIDTLGSSEKLACDLGANARQKIMKMDLSWDHIVQTLTGI